MATEEEIAAAAQLLRQGGLVAIPTETVYGLAANALEAAAVERIYRVKGRPRTSPLIVHVGSVEMARELALAWPEEAEVLCRRYWPGPLTIVVRNAPWCLTLSQRAWRQWRCACRRIRWRLK